MAASEISKMTAAILAGGLGTRLRSVVHDHPKTMAPIGGRPFLSFLLDQLVHTGIRRAVLCTGYRAEQIESHFATSYRGLGLSYSREDSQLGTAGGLRLALDKIQSPTVIVMNGDSYCSADLGAFASYHAAHDAPLSLLLAKVEDTSRFGSVQVNPQGTVTRFQEKERSAGAGWINAGVYLVQRTVIDRIEPDVPVSLERQVFPKWIGKGLMGWTGGGSFLDIGTPQSYARAEQFFTRQAAA